MANRIPQCHVGCLQPGARFSLRYRGSLLMRTDKATKTGYVYVVDVETGELDKLDPYTLVYSPYDPIGDCNCNGKDS